MERDGNGWRERAIRDAVLAGDSTAWRAWYDEHFAPLAEYIRWRCGGLPGLADDGVQGTWLTAGGRGRPFHPPPRGLFSRGLGGAAERPCNAGRGPRPRRKPGRAPA